jgi:hypothetical protein
MKIDNFVLLDSVYGKFIVPRTCLFQAAADRVVIAAGLGSKFLAAQILLKNAGEVPTDPGSGPNTFSPVPNQSNRLWPTLKIIRFIW